MPAVCFYFQVHQPYRIKRYRMYDIGADAEYFNDDSELNTNNARVLRKVAGKSYLPANRVLLELLKTHPEFRVSFSLSGVVLDQFERYAPEVLDSFRALVATGQVEVLAETYYHSLSALYSEKEFATQVRAHTRLIEKHFGVTPRAFRNTELIYSNAIADLVRRLGYRVMLAEGADHVLGWRSPNYLYTPPGKNPLVLLLKNYRLSDDIAFRFGERSWSEYPLSADRFANWISGHNGSADIINLFMDYETFGEHQWEDTGIFEFLRALPREVLRHPDNIFTTPSEAAKRFPVRGDIDMHEPVSWADVERDLSAWRSNAMQHDALRAVYALQEPVLATRDKELIERWRRLQTSDHFYYMCTKWFADGDVHKYFNPYESPYEAFLAYMNVLKDLELRIEKALGTRALGLRTQKREPLLQRVYNALTAKVAK